MIRRIWPLAWLLACTPEAGPPPVGVLLPPSEAVRVDVSPSVGGAPLEVPVRAVDALGVPVAAGAARVEVDGVEVEVPLDGHGYGVVGVPEPGTAVVGEVAVHATGAPWTLPALQRLVPGIGEASAVVPAAGGALVARSEAVWWVGVDGRAFPVLVAPEGEAVGGVRAAHLDLDGVIDGLAWVGSRVVLLRGRLAGGVSRGAVLAAEGWRVVSADVGDTDGDSLPDVAVVWASQGGSGALEVWEQTGPWRFAPAAPVDLPDAPHDVAVGDADGAQADEITITDASGQWLRYAWSRPGHYGQTGPRGPGFDMGLPEGTSVRSGFDFNGDGGDEILLLWPPPERGAHTLQVWDLVVEEFPRMFPLSAEHPWVALEDADGDGLEEIWTLGAGAALRTLARREGSNVLRAVATLPGAGPFAVAERTGDPVPDLLLVESQAASWWHGGTVELAEGTWWELGPPVHPALEVDLQGPLGVLEVDGDPDTLEILGFRSDPRTVLVAYRLQRGDPSSLVEVDIAVLSEAGGAPLDLAVCDGVAVVLTEDTLCTVEPGPTGGIVTTRRSEVAGDRVACADDAIALLDGEAVEIRDADLAVTGTEDHPGAVDLTLIDRGDGPEVATCDTPGCTIVAWPWGAGGEQALAIGDPDGVVVADGASQVRLAGAGEVAVVDADGDGVADLLVREGDRVLLYRSSGEGYGVPEGLHARMVVTPVIADATGDGGGDLLYLDDQGRLVVAGP